jgi:ubiquinone/menaquinone biosynthesis C-methylase UbiE
VVEMNRVARFFVNRSAARRAARRVRWLARSALPSGGACLEIGCGNAEFAARFVERWRPTRYLATDLDPRQLEEARRNLARHFPTGTPRGLLLEQADMLHLPVENAALDRVFAFVAIHHASPRHHDFSRVPDALREVDRVLRPGGAFVCTELFHQAPIREWLTAHGYALSGLERSWRLESWIAGKPG